jgi:uncharacterized membrane protein required for colicin V production
VNIAFYLGFILWAVSVVMWIKSFVVSARYMKTPIGQWSVAQSTRNNTRLWTWTAGMLVGSAIMLIAA